MFTVVSSIILIPIACIIWCFNIIFDRKLAILHMFGSFWGSLYLWVNPLWKLKIYNRKNFKKGQVYIIVSNHQSLADIFVLYRLFFHYKWVVKAELFKVPILGWNLALNRYIKLARGNTGGILKMMKDCEKALKQGSSLLIFPEGTRSVDGNLKRFKEGAFKIALAAKVPILPIVISGTNKAIPDKRLLLGGNQKIKVKVLEAITYESFCDLNASELAKKVHAVMNKKINELA